MDRKFENNLKFVDNKKKIFKGNKSVLFCNNPQTINGKFKNFIKTKFINSYK